MADSVPIVVELPESESAELEKLLDGYPGAADVFASRRHFNANEPVIQVVLLLTTATLSNVTLIIRAILQRHRYVRFKSDGIAIEGMSASDVERTLVTLLQAKGTEDSSTPR
jgi:hypothetical protein